MQLSLRMRFPFHDSQVFLRVKIARAPKRRQESLPPRGAARAPRERQEPIKVAKRTSRSDFRRHVVLPRTKNFEGVSRAAIFGRFVAFVRFDGALNLLLSATVATNMF